MEDKKFTAFVSQDEPETETPETPAEGTETPSFVSQDEPETETPETPAEGTEEAEKPSEE